MTNEFYLEKAVINNIDTELRSSRFDDIYFQQDDAINEVLHTYCLGNDLINRFKSLAANAHFYLLELGFGTGLNFIVTLKLWRRYAPTSATLHYIGCEKHPLTISAIDSALAQFGDYKEELLTLKNLYPYPIPGAHRRHTTGIELTLLYGDALTLLRECWNTSDQGFIDACYLDGFAPRKNPELWSMEIMTQVARLSKPHQTTVATFSVAKLIRERLHQAGFLVQKRQGKGRKREVLSATYNQLNTANNAKRTGWLEVGSKNAVLGDNLSIAIVGGGLAGCILAYTLAQENLMVTIYERGGALALAGSGNKQAVCDFRPSLYRSPYNDFMLTSFLYSDYFYRKHHVLEVPYLIRLIDNDKYFTEMASFFARFPELGSLLTSSDLQQELGIKTSLRACHIKAGGFISPHKLCAKLVNHKHISVKFNCAVNDIKHTGSGWQVNKEKDMFEGLIWAAASNPRLIDAHTKFVSDYRGENREVSPSLISEKLAATVTGLGHICPYHDKQQTISASPALMKLFELNETDIIATRFANRAKTFDYMPHVGTLPKRDDFLKQYASLSKDKNRVVSGDSPSYPHLYLFTGFGSHGVTTIPYAAELLKDYLLDRPSISSKQSFKHVCPQRQLIKALFQT